MALQETPQADANAETARFTKRVFFENTRLVKRAVSALAWTWARSLHTLSLIVVFKWVNGFSGI